MAQRLNTVVLSVALLFIWGQIAVAQEALVDMAQRANTLYEQGDYPAAQGLYETIVAGGVHDKVVYYNLGQIYFAQQKAGYALLQYRRAQQLAPRDPELNIAMALVRAGREDIQGDDTALVDSLAALTIPILTFDELNWLSLALWTGCFVLAGVYVTRPGWRNSSRIALFVLGIGLLLALVLWSSRVYATIFRPPAVVIAATAPVMSGPGEDYLQIYELHAAAEMRILEEREGWSHFVLPDGREGWIQFGIFEKV